MKKLIKPLLAMVLFMAMLQNNTVAQQPANEITTSSDANGRDYSNMWGLLGLVGLLGLIRMNKTERGSTYSTTNVPQNRQ